MTVATRASLSSPEPGEACSYAELRTAEDLAERIGETGRNVLWRPVWVLGDPGLHSALVAVAATLIGLASIEWPVPAGFALTLLLALWSLELGGIARPLAMLQPKRASQDVIADDPRGSTGVGSVLLLVRADLPRRRPRVIEAVSSRLGELAWLVLALTLLAAAGRALEWNEDTIALAQLAPAMFALGMLSVALLGRWSQPIEPIEGWTGVDQALEAIAVLDREETVVRRSNLAVVGASDIGGTTRILRSDGSASVACRCWEFRSGAEVLDAIGEAD
ncbi:MAG: hypothetical protein WCO96_00105 [Actinomycetes bacterium]